MVRRTARGTPTRPTRNPRTPKPRKNPSGVRLDDRLVFIASESESSKWDGEVTIGMLSK